MNEFGGNLEFKEKYLNELKRKGYSESTHRNAHLILRNAKFYEESYNKDVYNFNLTEMNNMLKGFRIKTTNALKHRMSVYSKYINRAVQEGLTTGNVMDMILPDQYVSLIDKKASIDRYITKEELFDNISYLTNAQDQIIFALLFDGVMGKNYSNLVNLKINDIDEETLVAKLFDGDEVTLSKDTYNLVQLAISEDTYDTYSESEIVYPLAKNEYVVRVPKRPKGNELEPVRANSIRTKVDLFKKDLDMQGLTGRSIYLSGVAYRFLDEFKDIDEDFTISELSVWLKDNKIKTNSTEMMGIINMILNKG